MQEQWKKVDGFPMYSISSCGRLRNDKSGRVLKSCPDKDGYLQNILCNNGIKANRKIHRLVAVSFIPNPDAKPQLNHIDGDKTNNNVENLEWVTHQENSDHFWRVLDCKEHRDNLSKAHIGKGILSENSNAKAVRRIEDGKIYSTIKEAGEDNGIQYHHIGEVCKGKRKTAGGCHWEFLKEAI